MSTKLLCLGDIMLGENLSHYKRGIKSTFDPDYKKLLDPVFSDMLLKEKPDLIFYNMEYCITQKEDFNNKTLLENVFKGTPDSLSLFQDFPIIVSVANNHFGQHGPDVCRFTKNLLKEKNILYTGGSSSPTVVNSNGSQFLIWGVTLIGDKYDSSEYFKSSYKTLLKELNLPQKSENEKWVISVHWGDEYLDTPSEEQINLSRQLVDSGFDLIIGHHSHTLQPVEFYKEKLIIYSLGNFLFDQNFSKRTSTGLVLTVLLKANPTIIKAYFSRQKKYIIHKLKEVDVKKIELKKSAFNYQLKKKLLNYWYRILMKIELIQHYKKIDSETINYFSNKLRKIKH